MRIVGANAGRYFFAKNLEGDVVAIYDTSGTLKARYFYLAHGHQMVLNPDYTQNGSASFIGNVNPFRYRGYYFDREINKYYLQSRYYDQETGRFINADDASMLTLGMSTLGGTNLFAYCLNNPIMETDPSGYLSNNWKMIIGMVTITAAVMITIATGGTATPIVIGVLANSLIGYGIGALVGGEQAAIDGYADAFMYSGILSLVSSSISAVKSIYTARKGIVIGETMTRFTTVANNMGAKTYGGLPKYNFIEKQFGKNIAQELGLSHNRLWIKRMLHLRANVTDIGLNLYQPTRSINYAMEIYEVLRYYIFF